MTKDIPECAVTQLTDIQIFMIIAMHFCTHSLAINLHKLISSGVNGNFHIDEGINLENISLKKEKFESYGMRLSRSLS